MTWIERKADTALQRARHMAATTTGVRQKLALAALDCGEVIAEKRSFGDVYDRKSIPILGPDGLSYVLQLRPLLPDDASAG